MLILKETVQTQRLDDSEQIEFEGFFVAELDRG